MLTRSTYADRVKHNLFHKNDNYSIFYKTQTNMCLCYNLIAWQMFNENVSYIEQALNKISKLDILKFYI